MKVKEILRKDFSVKGNVDSDISGVAYDSRNVKDGDLFVAIKGEKFDAHDFIEDAIKRGAVAVIYEDSKRDLSELMSRYSNTVWIGVKDCRDALAAISCIFYGNPSEKVTVIGITGTNGKTTTSYLIKSVMERWGKSVGLIGTINYMIKDRVYEAPHTTPESVEFQSLLRRMSDNGCDYVVSEVSSHALSQKRADYTKFAAAVFTNLTRDHLDFHKTMEDYFDAKSRLFSELLSEGGVAAINIDDPYGVKLVNILKDKKVKILTYSLKKPDADLTAFDIKTTFKETSFRIKMNVNKKIIEDIIISPLVGTINVYNILSAICVALSFSVPLKIIKEGISKVGAVKGRFERVDMGQDFLAVVDYAHTEDALEQLLLNTRQLLETCTLAGMHKKKSAKSEYAFLPDAGEKGKIITVFGCGGNRDRGKRAKMGEIATRLSDLVIITSDNPRYEDPRDIISDIEMGVKNDNYIIIPDRNIAVSMAVELASPGDIVLVAGKGHEDYQEIQGNRYHFSDSEILRNAIMGMTSLSSNETDETDKKAGAIRC
jgi:UDP-N-acetylmuramoyl-L-alanyl-D-glutamate--2,6-diaminopimelate ligase